MSDLPEGVHEWLYLFGIDAAIHDPTEPEEFYRATGLIFGGGDETILPKGRVIVVPYSLLETVIGAADD